MKPLKEALFSKKNLSIYKSDIKIDGIDGTCLEVSIKKDSILFSIIDGRIKFSCEVKIGSLPEILRVLNQVDYDSGNIPDIHKGYDLNIFFSVFDSTKPLISIDIEDEGDVVEVMLDKTGSNKLLNYLRDI